MCITLYVGVSGSDFSKNLTYHARVPFPHYACTARAGSIRKEIAEPGNLKRMSVDGETLTGNGLVFCCRSIYN